MGAELPTDATERAHRIGKKFDVEVEEEDRTVTEVTKQRAIINFSSWKHRTLVYRNKKKTARVQRSRLT